jgi:hypothetical protein
MEPDCGMDGGSGTMEARMQWAHQVRAALSAEENIHAR